MKNSDRFKTRWGFFRSLARYIWKGSQTWIGKELKYNGKLRLVEKETYDSVYLEGIEKPINKRHWRKENDKFKPRK